MEDKPLELRLLHPTIQVDADSMVVIKCLADLASNLMLDLGEQGKPIIMVDNNAISMRKPDSKMISVAGYALGGRLLYLLSTINLYSKGSLYFLVPLPKLLDEMAESEIQEIAADKSNINPQLICALAAYLREDAA